MWKNLTLYQSIFHFSSQCPSGTDGNNTALALATIIPPACPITLKTFIWKPSSDHKATCAFLFTGVYIFNHMGRDLSHALTHGYVYKQ